MPASKPHVVYRDPRGYQYAEIAIDALNLDAENARTDPQESSLDALVALIKDDADGLFTLAHDIVREKGTNPGELPHVTPTDDGYVVREANRRLACRKILRNPEQLRDHVSDDEFKRWSELAKNENAKALPDKMLVVLGGNHEVWIDRRHLGKQSGAGLVEWNYVAKLRREGYRTDAAANLPLRVLDALRTRDEARFGPLVPTRNFTTWERMLDSTEGREMLGVSLDDKNQVVFKYGERTIEMLERFLMDLQRPRTDDKRVTSRTIHTREQIKDYIGKLDRSVKAEPSRKPVIVDPVPPPATPAPPIVPKSMTARKPPDILRTFRQPTHRRLLSLLEELAFARKHGKPNAATMVLRVLLELTIDKYASDARLDIGGDTNPEMEQAVNAFRAEVGKAGVRIDKAVNQALKLAAGRPLGITVKLEKVLDHLIANKKIQRKEGEAIKRNLNQRKTMTVLNDAFHRLSATPSLDEITHALEDVADIYNAIVPGPK